MTGMAAKNTGNAKNNTVRPELSLFVFFVFLVANLN